MSAEIIDIDLEGDSDGNGNEVRFLSTNLLLRCVKVMLNGWGCLVIVLVSDECSKKMGKVGFSNICLLTYFLKRGIWSPPYVFFMGQCVYLLIQDNGLKYVDGKCWDWHVDIDKLTVRELFQKISIARYDPDMVEHIWYLEPGKTLSDGLKQVIGVDGEFRVEESQKESVVEDYYEPGQDFTAKGVWLEKEDEAGVGVEKEDEAGASKSEEVADDHNDDLNGDKEAEGDEGHYDPIMDIPKLTDNEDKEAMEARKKISTWKGIQMAAGMSKKVGKVGFSNMCLLTCFLKRGIWSPPYVFFMGQCVYLYGSNKGDWGIEKHVLFIHIGGRLIQDNGLKYVDGECWDWHVDIDKLTVRELFQKVSIARYDPHMVEHIWYLEPGKTLSDGLKQVIGDASIRELLDILRVHNKVHIYVIHIPDFPFVVEQFLALPAPGDDANKGQETDNGSKGVETEGVTHGKGIDGEVRVEESQKQGVVEDYYEPGQDFTAKGVWLEKEDEAGVGVEKEDEAGVGVEKEDEAGVGVEKEAGAGVEKERACASQSEEVADDYNDDLDGDKEAEGDEGHYDPVMDIPELTDNEDEEAMEARKKVKSFCYNFQEDTAGPSSYHDGGVNAVGPSTPLTAVHDDGGELHTLFMKKLKMLFQI
ncbi:hypothetical protein SLEP1_g27690 [Rubroshorea leprosula]|uniref:PB1-like domain-containing protein n=1 Tax=Rubroshorea leprosula TaxID=152421 RepID=A0AAV5JR68_9ROSI|nr:hypothetical protein SLEP1_g27690 [Rubroshorea leprosula]